MNVIAGQIPSTIDSHAGCRWRSLKAEIKLHRPPAAAFSGDSTALAPSFHNTSICLVFYLLVICHRCPGPAYYVAQDLTPSPHLVRTLDNTGRPIHSLLIMTSQRDNASHGLRQRVWIGAKDFRWRFGLGFFSASCSCTFYGASLRRLCSESLADRRYGLQIRTISSGKDFGPFYLTTS